MDKPQLKAEHGFTLVELLVVILIIGVLAAIALPIFLDQRVKSQDAEAKAAVTTTAKAFAIWHQDHDTYAGADIDDLADIEPTIASARGLEITGTADTFTVKVDSVSGASGGGPFRLRHENAVNVRTCDAAGEGGCRGSGDW